MTKNIHQAFFPLLFTASVLGVGAFKYPMSRSFICIHFIYILCLWTGYIYTLQHFYKYNTFHSIFDSTVSVLTVYINMFTTATTTFFSLYYSKNIGECLKKISVVDDTLQELGFPKDYEKIRRLMIFVVLGWIATALFMNNIGFLWTNEDITIHKVATLAIMNHFVHINTTLDLTFIIMLLYGKSRFSKLNEYIIVRCKNRRNRGKIVQENPMTSSRNGIVIKNTTVPLEDYDIWISMHIHLELSRICNNMNTIFGVQMALEMTSFFILITGLVCELYATLTTYEVWDSWKIKNVLDIIMWSTFYLIKLFCINYTCEKISFEANRTQDLIQKVMDCLRLTIREEVFQFISEMTYKQLKLSALGFYTFGYCFIRQFFGTTTTFLIMLLQVESSPTFPNNSTFS